VTFTYPTRENRTEPGTEVRVAHAGRGNYAPAFEESTPFEEFIMVTIAALNQNPKNGSQPR
jgi:hypothetical protein